MVELLGLEAHARFRAELPMELLGVVERLLNWGDFKDRLDCVPLARKSEIDSLCHLFFAWSRSSDFLHCFRCAPSSAWLYVTTYSRAPCALE